ncbi:unnamed protein product [Orchesella dallaii]|uniref:Uncharacterized protein n=1 Tax=Orchesella dallaii TaxID=48710 RepID=A0ABP1RHV1_9HEXA
MASFENSKIKKAVSDLEDTTKNIEEKLKTLQIDNESLGCTIQTLDKGLKTAYSNYSQLDEQCKTLWWKTFTEQKLVETRLEGYKLDVERLEKELKDTKISHKIEVDKLEKDVNETKSKNNALNSQLESISSENIDLKEKNESSLRKIRRLEREMLCKYEEVKSLEIKVHNLTVEGRQECLQIPICEEVPNGNLGQNNDNKLEDENRTLKEKIGIVQSEKTELLEKVKNLEYLNKNAEKKLKKLENEKELLIIDKQNDVGKLTEELQETEARRRNLEDLVDDLNNSLRKLTETSASEYKKLEETPRQKLGPSEEAKKIIKDLKEQINYLLANSYDCVLEGSDNLLDESSAGELLEESEETELQNKKKPRELEEREQNQLESKRIRLHDGGGAIQDPNPDFEEN